MESLSEKKSANNNSWDEGFNGSDAEYYSDYYEQDFDDEINKDESSDGPEIIYNINGEIIDP